MGLASDLWTGNLEDGSPLDGTELYAYFNELRTNINDIVNAQINANAGIAGSKLADNSVTGAKIADDSITNAKMADNSVGTAELIAQAVTRAKLQVFSVAGTGVGTANIEDGAVTGAKLAAGTFGESSILWDDVTNGLQAPHIGGNQIRLIYGVKSGLALTDGVAVDDSISFATNATQFVENFSTTTGMMVGGSLVFASAPTINTYGFVGPFFYTLATTGFSFRYKIESAGSPALSLHFWALGSVA